jgi:hypothetical protein
MQWQCRQAQEKLVARLKACRVRWGRCIFCERRIACTAFGSSMKLRSEGALLGAVEPCWQCAAREAVHVLLRTQGHRTAAYDNGTERSAGSKRS